MLEEYFDSNGWRRNDFLNYKMSIYDWIIASSFRKYMSSKYPNINFTVQQENVGSLIRRQNLS